MTGSGSACRGLPIRTGMSANDEATEMQDQCLDAPPWPDEVSFECTCLSCACPVHGEDLAQGAGVPLAASDPPDVGGCGTPGCSLPRWYCLDWAEEWSCRWRGTRRVFSVEEAEEWWDAGFDFEDAINLHPLIEPLAARRLMRDSRCHFEDVVAVVVSMAARDAALGDENPPEGGAADYLALLTEHDVYTVGAAIRAGFSARKTAALVPDGPLLEQLEARSLVVCAW